MIVVYVEDVFGKLYSYVLFNFKIVSYFVEKSYLISGEGCLFVDEVIFGYVFCYVCIRVKGIIFEGENIDICLKGFLVIVFQYEIDYLNGVMFYDYIDKENFFKEFEYVIVIEC